MQIHSLTIKEYDQLVQLWEKSGLPFKPRGRDSKQAIELQMKSNPDFFLGAFEGARLVGVVIVSCDGRKGWINRLAVDPNYRRHGIAKALIAEAEEVLRRHGVRVFSALIEGSNQSSKILFMRCGYVEHRNIIYFSKRDAVEIWHSA